MPKDHSIETILVIGSGPIVIGQAAEFDYAGTQACIALKEEGYKVILVNNNPATIMTDSSFADRIYFEPLTVDVVEKIIAKERPDGLLATLGGQTGLNLAFQLHEQGILQKYNVKMLGTPIESIKRGEDREAFRALMKELHEPVPESEIVHSVEEALRFGEKIGFPIIVRPAYTLGGTGGGIASNKEELAQLVNGGLNESPINQCLIEKSIAGFKEIEFEVMRDRNNTCITVCHMENFDPVGIHTGDSIVVAPTQTLTADEVDMLKKAAVKIISALGIIGGCNIQFALDPKSKQYYLIEVNPRVSRSSALASKATGYPIARLAAKLAVGFTLDEIENPLTGEIYGDLEPVLDYVIVKIPKWPFDKFTSIDRKLGTQMKATGEVMGIDRNFERAFQKAIRSLEVELDGLILKKLTKQTEEQLFVSLREQNDERVFILFELLRRGVSIEQLHHETKIDLFFLHYLKKLIDLENEIKETTFDTVTVDQLQRFKEKGFSDAFIANVWGVSEKQLRNKRIKLGIIPSYKMVDTCAAEYEAKSNYFYSTYFGENEQYLTSNKKVLIIGSGPIRIGQGIEFDYCSVHGVFALKEEGIETILINNNPETVSTDFHTADKLYFEPLTVEDILNVVESEQVTDIIIQLGGQTAINLAKDLEQYGVNLLGTDSNTIDQLEDRELFYQLLDHLNIPHLQGDVVHSDEQLYQSVEKIGFPVLLRPSFVIGGSGMEIIRNKHELKNYVDSKVARYPFLVDEFLHAKEAEMDLVTDGKYILAPTIMEHIEKTGVHSGDSMAMMPSQSISKVAQEKMYEYARKIATHLHYKGLMNIQFIVNNNDVYVLEVNPRASRTVPIVSKATGIPLVQIATKILLGKYTLSKNDESNNLKDIPYVSVKYPIFSNYALKGLDSKVTAEMRSTGEGISFGTSLNEALRKVFHPSLNKKKLEIVMKEPFTELEELKKKEEIQFIVSNDEHFLHPDVIAYYNPNSNEEDKQLREYATKNRILTFTEKESLIAFIHSLEVSSFDVKAIEDWRLMLREDVIV